MPWLAPDRMTSFVSHSPEACFPSWRRMSWYAIPLQMQGVVGVPAGACVQMGDHKRKVDHPERPLEGRGARYAQQAPLPLVIAYPGLPPSDHTRGTGGQRVLWPEHRKCMTL